jgi:hypothetical protein
MSKILETLSRFIKNIIPKKRTICRKSILATAKYSRGIPFIWNKWIVEVNYYDEYRKLHTKKYYYRDEMEAMQGEIIIKSFAKLCEKCYKSYDHSHEEMNICTQSCRKSA